MLGFKVLVSNTTNMTSLKETKKENPQGSLRWHISPISFRNVVFLQTPSQNDTGRTNVSFKKIGGGRMVGSFDVIFFKSREHHKKKKTTFTRITQGRIRKIMDYLNTGAD